MASCMIPLALISTYTAGAGDFFLFDLKSTEDDAINPNDFSPTEITWRD